MRNDESDSKEIHRISVMDFSYMLQELVKSAISNGNGDVERRKDETVTLSAVGLEIWLVQRK